MKILLHGATGFSTTNFGDCLFAILFYDNAKEYGDVYFWDISAFLKDKIKNLAHDKNKINFDILIYISGGYFADPYRQSFKYNLLNLYRYYLVGLLCALLKKPIAIIGVDVDHSIYKINMFLFKYIYKHASVVAVRNSESVKAICEMGLDARKVVEISDTALNIRHLDIRPSSEVLRVQSINKKKLLWHFNHVNDVFLREYEAINLFLDENPDYCLVIADDCVLPENLSNRTTNRQIDSTMRCNTVFYYQYNDPLDMCALINSCDFVLTYKLHVGIVAVSYHKSVVSIPQYYEKVYKYYNQIGEASRCHPLSSTSTELLHNLLSQYKDVPISLSQNIVEKSQQGFALLQKFLGAHCKK